jgi:asparagine synthetase B (glutamine-hydrolysing)
MRRTCGVAMTGEAADEVFGGYPYFFKEEEVLRRDGFPWMFDGPKLADYLSPDVNRKKSAYPHVQNPEYDRMLVREATWIADDPATPLAWMFDTPRINRLIRQIDEGRLHCELPGGSNPAALLIQLVEMRHWMDDYHVATAV